MTFGNTGPVFNDEEVTHDFRKSPQEHGEFWYGYALGAQRAIVRYERLVDQLQSILAPSVDVVGEPQTTTRGPLILHNGIEDDYVPDDEEDNDGVSPFMG